MRVSVKDDMELESATSQCSLYLQEKYPVLMGKQTPFALCTCWTDPKVLVRQHPELLEHFSLIGTLYSIEGISIMLRNLCLQPHIKYVLVWAHSPLSQTVIGKKGWQSLFSLFECGVSTDHCIVGTSALVHKEISLDAIETVRTHVVLYDVSSQEAATLSQFLTESNFPPLSSDRLPVSFPEPSRDAICELPSERVGWLIRKPTIAQSWLSTVERILQYGKLKRTEYGSQQKELLAVSWVIEHESLDQPYLPDWPIKDIIGLDLSMLEKYKTTFLDPSKKIGIAYTYGERLRAYDGTLDQIQVLIDKLKSSVVSRRAVAVTVIPEVDLFDTSPPCLNHVQVIVDDRVHLIALFRSQDIFKAGISNAFGLLHLQGFIAKELGYPMGTLTIHSNSAHLYEEDFENARQLVACKLWGDLHLSFNEHTDLDSRGIVRIALCEGKIHVTLHSLEGMELSEFVGVRARDLIMTLARRDLLSRTDHYCDITLELVKAELALQAGLSYTQDQPMRIGELILR